MVSPHLNTSNHPLSHPPWRNVIRATWTHLHQHYDIHVDDRCTTRIQIHTNVDFTLPELKRIISAIIHFEPVMSPLLNQRGPDSSPKRNWQDHPRLGKANLSQHQSIAAIQAIEPSPKLGDTAPLLQFIQASYEGEYCWDFSCLSHGGPIRYWQPPPCRTADDAVQWAELALSFIRGALACKPQRLEKIAPNHTGLQYFLSGVRSGEYGDPS